MTPIAPTSTRHLWLQIVQMVKGGITVSEAASEVGVCDSTAYAACRAAGMKFRRGFAAMSPDKQREIASKGGKAGHRLGRAHQFTSDEARRAGRIGGASLARVRGSDYMAALGRRGGASGAAKGA